MAVVAQVSFSNQFAVKASLTGAGFIRSDQKDGALRRIESESNSPNAIGGIKAQFLHVRVTRSFQSIDAFAASLWSHRF